MLFFLHLKLELLTQFPASNDENNTLRKNDIFQIEEFDQLGLFNKLFDKLQWQYNNWFEFCFKNVYIRNYEHPQD